MSILQSNIKRVSFKDINLQDPFFDSLRNDYEDFDTWFSDKIKAEAPAFVHYDENNCIDGFMYLKTEKMPVEDTHPPILFEGRLFKVGTFKVKGHGTKFADRFILKMFQAAMKGAYDKLYVTIFSEKQENLTNRLKKFGFVYYGKKKLEDVYIKDLRLYNEQESLYFNYPMMRPNNFFLLAIRPQWHTPLFPDAQLQSEKDFIPQDINYANSITKIYIGFRQYAINADDAVIIYRTKEKDKPAHYCSVLTSLCSVVEVKYKDDFSNAQDLWSYCQKNTVFSEEEVFSFWRNNDKLTVIKLLYSASFPTKVTRKELLDHQIISHSRLLCEPVSYDQALWILDRAKVQADHYIK